MQSVRKVKLVPPKNQIGGGELTSGTTDTGSLSSPVEKITDKIKSKIYDKIHRFIKIILKLARTVGYDNDLRIKLKNGKYLEKSNIVDLLTHAMSVGKVLYGESEFISLLAESNVDPNLIINDNVRLKLIQFKNKTGSTYETKDYNEEIVDNSEEAEFESESNSRNQLKAIRKGNKKLIVDNSGEIETNAGKMDQKRNKNYITVHEDGATLNLDSPKSVTRTALKRKADELDEDEDSVDDDMIDDTRWKIN